MYGTRQLNLPILRDPGQTFAHIQGVAGHDEGTPPRDVGDTYSQSTDPSDDEEQEGRIDDFEAAGPSKHATSGQQAPKERPARGAEQGHHSEIPGPSAQPAHQHDSLQQEPSVTLDTQHDPDEDANMQEGKTSVKTACTPGCMCQTRLLQQGCSSNLLVIAALNKFAHAWLFAVGHMQETSWIWTQSPFPQRIWVKMQQPAKINSMLPSCLMSLLHLSQQDRRLQPGGADDTLECHILPLLMLQLLI